MPKYFFHFEIKTKKLVSSDYLSNIIDLAEHKTYSHLLSRVGKHFIKFSLDAKATIATNRIILDIVLDLELSPLIKEFSIQDKIAEELANVFANEISKNVG